jgi:hypothetical protein
MPVIVIRKTINRLAARQFKDAIQETGNVEQTVQSGLPFLVFQHAVPFLFVPGELLREFPFSPIVLAWKLQDRSGVQHQVQTRGERCTA